MPREHDERIEQAEKLFQNGLKLKEIAKQLELPEGTVRSWKKRYNWDCNVAIKKNATLQTKSKQKKQRISEAVEVALENGELNAEQQMFCLFYASNPNATRAYQKAYKCSYETAMANGSRLLRIAKIRDEIKHLKKERFENMLFDEKDIFQWYLDIATASITDYVTFGRESVPVMTMFGPLKDKETGEAITKEENYVKFRSSEEVDGRVIKKVKMGRNGASIELHDQMKAMEWLTEHMSMGNAQQQSLANSIVLAYEKRKEQHGSDN